MKQQTNIKLKTNEESEKNRGMLDKNNVLIMILNLTKNMTTTFKHVSGQTNYTHTL